MGSLSRSARLFCGECCTLNIMHSNSRAMVRMDIGFYSHIKLWLLRKSCPFGLPAILSGAHMGVSINWALPKNGPLATSAQGPPRGVAGIVSSTHGPT